jgi:hypothetical protein
LKQHDSIRRRVAALAVAVIAGALLAGCGPEATVTSHSCERKPDGSMHVQGKLRNDGSTGVVLVEFWVKYYGGERKAKSPFGGYEVPGDGEESAVGEDFNVPSGEVPVDCGVEIKA